MMSDTELYALAVLVAAETAAMQADNADRAHHEQSMAYIGNDFDQNRTARALREELERRKVIA